MLRLPLLCLLTATLTSLPASAVMASRARARPKASRHHGHASHRRKPRKQAQRRVAVDHARGEPENALSLPLPQAVKLAAGKPWSQRHDLVRAYAHANRKSLTTDQVIHLVK